MGVGTFPYFGVPILEGEWGMVGWRTTVYRWHMPDPVRFNKSLRVEIENTGWISEDELKPGVHRGLVERNDDYATVAFWYQVGQPKRFATLPSAAERRLPNLDLIVEGKQLLKTAAKSQGDPDACKRATTGPATGSSSSTTPRARATWIEVRVPRREGRTPPAHPAHDVFLRLTASTASCSTARRSASRVDFYSAEVKVRELNLGQRRLSAGQAQAPPGMPRAARPSRPAASWASTPSAFASAGT